MKKKINKNPDLDIKQLKTCFLSSFPPRECGIASFTDDLSRAMDKVWNPKLKSQVVPVIMITHYAKEKNLRTALKMIDKLADIKEKSVAIRIEGV